MKMDLAQTKAFGKKVIDDHIPMMSLYQTIADNFYPERADFTIVRNIGTELADLLVDSYPILVRRDLGDSLSAMLRDGKWFEVGIDGEPDHLGRMWLQWASERLMKLVKARSANFTRSTKEGDHDFVTFGQCCISVQKNKKGDGLLYRCWHLRDVSWYDDESGEVGGVVRKWSPTYGEMKRYFGDNVHPDIKKATGKDEFKKGKVLHMVIPSETYGDPAIEARHKWVSIFIDTEKDHIMEERGMNNKIYVIPRFKTIPGSPFAYSPATVCGLPDARSIQQMQYTLLEAGERYTRPPLIATQKAIRSDVDLAADGITWVDDEYDEKMGAALRPLVQNSSGFPIGLELKQDLVDTLKAAFYANRLSLPETGQDMTAYEVGVRMKQYRRENIPLFAPIEEEYNGQICELSFDVAMDAGFLGSPYDIPESLADRDVVFKFESPLNESEEEKKMTQFSQVIEMTTAAMTLDESVGANINIDEALRDAITGTGAPENWKHDPEKVQMLKEGVAQARAAQAALESGVDPEQLANVG
jgi:hypothetical protein